MDHFSFYLIIGLIFLIALSIIFTVIYKAAKAKTLLVLQFAEKEKHLGELRREAEGQLLVSEDRYNELKKDIDNKLSEIRLLRDDNLLLNRQLEKMKADYDNTQVKLAEQKTELESLQKKFTAEFENIASKILKQNTEDFSLANQKQLVDVLSPLKEKIQLFEKKVDDTYQKGLKDQTDLRAELKKLYELNHRMSTEAENLTRALKGDVKKQGNWGEVVLERILERSGLNEGEQGYQKQFSTTSDDGKRLQPDVVINLPDNKHIIIDSKVSLVAYERAVNSTTDVERDINIREHLVSLKGHIKGLSEKHYQSVKSLNCPDFVLLFIPIESSFSLAVQADNDLFAYAWDQKVVLVSPSTLLATLRTIASIWQQENQTRNAIEIARQGGALYDKFVGFIKDMDKIGSNLRTTQNTYDAAMKKLSEGRGNLVVSTEKLKEMGAKTTKQIPKSLLDINLPDEDFQEETSRAEITAD